MTGVDLLRLVLFPFAWGGPMVYIAFYSVAFVCIYTFLIVVTTETVIDTWVETGSLCKSRGTMVQITWSSFTIALVLVPFSPLLAVMFLPLALVVVVHVMYYSYLHARASRLYDLTEVVIQNPQSD